MSEPALRPCPFCGAPGKLFSLQMDPKITLWWVQCSNSHCIARRQVMDDREAAIAAWNERMNLNGNIS